MREIQRISHQAELGATATGARTTSGLALIQPATTRELYPDVVDGPDEVGGVPSRLIKTDAGDGGQRHAVVDVRGLGGGEDEEVAVALDVLAREGARRMIATALEAEVGEYVERFADERDEDGKRLVVRNGRARERKVTVGSDTVAIQAPRVNDKRVDGESGERQRFSSRIAGLRAALAESTRVSARARCASIATRTCSSTASTSRCAWARTTASACSS
jgi:hypothetical protein